MLMLNTLGATDVWTRHLWLMQTRLTCIHVMHTVIYRATAACQWRLLPRLGGSVPMLPPCEWKRELLSRVYKLMPASYCTVQYFKTDILAPVCRVWSKNRAAANVLRSWVDYFICAYVGTNTLIFSVNPFFPLARNNYYTVIIEIFWSKSIKEHTPSSSRQISDWFHILLFLVADGWIPSNQRNPFCCSHVGAYSLLRFRWLMQIKACKI